MHTKHFILTAEQPLSLLYRAPFVFCAYTWNNSDLVLWLSSKINVKLSLVLSFHKFCISFTRCFPERHVMVTVNTDYFLKSWYYWENLRLINPLNSELNPICYLLALLWAHHFLHVSRIRVKSLTLRLLMSYIYGAPILDVSRSHTTTQHSR